MKRIKNNTLFFVMFGVLALALLIGFGFLAVSGTIQNRPVTITINDESGGDEINMVLAGDRGIPPGATRPGVNFEARPVGIRTGQGILPFCLNDDLTPQVTITDAGQLIITCGIFSPTATPAPTETATVEPTNPPPTETPPPTATPAPTETATVEPTPTGVAMIEPYNGSPFCDEIGVEHDPNAWHGVWNYQNGCKWGHDHKMNPHDLDWLYNTANSPTIFDYIGGDFGPPWQTFSIFDNNTQTYLINDPFGANDCLENVCKHQGYQWFNMTNGREVADQSLLLGSQYWDSARVLFHQVGGEAGALTRFHSVTFEGIACPPNVTVAPGVELTRANAADHGCGYLMGANWLDFGRLNFPQRGIYAPLPGDNPLFGNEALTGPPEAAPYRIHPTGINSLDSWQSENNHLVQGLESDLDHMLNVGLGVHFLNGNSPGETNPGNFLIPQADRVTQFHCVDPVTKIFTCKNDSSAAAMFRIWATLPKSLDGGPLDLDGQVNGRLTFYGFTNRWGVIVEGCSGPGLDCIPWVVENFPVGDCNQDFCKAAYRGSIDRDGFDSLTVDGNPSNDLIFPTDPREPVEPALKYPN